MIRPEDLRNRMVPPAKPTSDQQREIVAVVREYIAVSRGEWPSSGWLARRLSISRQRAYEQLLRCREWLTPDPP